MSSPVSDPTIGALIRFAGGAVAPSYVEFLDPDRLADVAGSFAHQIESPGARAAVLAGIDLLADYGPVVISGPMAPLTILAKAGFAVATASKRLDAVLDGVARIDDRLRRIDGRLDRMEETLEMMSSQLNRIEQKVDWANLTLQDQELRTAIIHLLKVNVREDGLDVRGLCEGIVRSIGSFGKVFGPAGMKLGDGIGLTFNVETHSLLHRLYRLLQGIRFAAFAQANQSAGGDPSRMIVTDAVTDYWPATVATTNAFVLRFQVGELLRPVGDKARPVRKWTEDLDTEAVRLEETFRKLIPARGAYWWIETFRPWWLYETDAGLLWRVLKEAEGLRGEYGPFLRGRELPAPEPLLIGVGSQPEL